VTGAGTGGFLRFVLAWARRLPWSLRRGLIFLALVTVVPLLLLTTRLALALDELIFRRYRRRRVEAPLFIVGNFRSGTTFLHRLLVQDTRFCSMTMWEILFAPAVVQRKLVWSLALLDRLLGRPVGRLVDAMERGWSRRNVMHRVALRAPEEDEYLLLYRWSALTVGLSSGLLDLATPYAWFDQRLPAAERGRIMGFYRRCVQRHLFAHAAAPGGTYLAKNPALCPKIDSLLGEFPDARIVYLVRNPLEVVPSFLSMMQFSWRAVGVPVDQALLRDYLLEMLLHWYRYPLTQLARLPADRYAIVCYDDLVRDPEATVRALYRRFGLPLSADFAAVLEQARTAAPAHRSRHEYSLTALGLDRELILRRFADVFERCGFDSRAGPAGSVSTH
jgi:hypothetical protein